MNILHTSDLHLGKRLFDRERLKEQEEVLDEIEEICKREEISLVLIAGDVFDTFLPPADAEELFFRAVKKLAGTSRAVVVVSGNHDDGVRLAAGAPLAEEEGIYLFGNRPRAFQTGGNRPVRAVEAGEYYLVIEDGHGDRVYINALPYPNEARFKEGNSEETFPEKMARWIARGEEGYHGDLPHILLSHLFVAGGKVSESERDIDLGGARAVPLRLLPEEGYVALGHLHRPQQIGNARYSGSVLQYSFDEANTEKSVLVFKTEGKGFSDVRKIPLRSGRKLVRLECGSLSQALELLPKYENCYIELTLRLSEPLTSGETKALRDCSEGLVTIIPKVSAGEVAPIEQRAALSGGELFSLYYRSVYGEEPSGELTGAFLSLLGEEEEA